MPWCRPAWSAAAADPATTELADPAATSASEPPLNPQSVFEADYEKRTLSIQAPDGCCDERYIDLDAPRVDAKDNADIFIDTVGPAAVPNMHFSEGVVAAIGESAMTPNQCVEQIQYSALAVTKGYALRKGDAYCIQTSRAAANSLGDRQRMVVVTVTGVSADRLVTLQATAYSVPR